MKNYGLTNIFGFDLNEKGPNIYNNDIVYAVTIMAHKHQKPFIVDADFCRSYKNDGYNLAIIVATMKAMMELYCGHLGWNILKIIIYLNF